MQKLKKLTTKSLEQKVHRGLKTESVLQQILKECQEINANVTALKLPAWQNKQLLTLNEFCEYTGISKSYAYYLTANNLIPTLSQSSNSYFLTRRILMHSFARMR